MFDEKNEDRNQFANNILLDVVRLGIGFLQPLSCFLSVLRAFLGSTQRPMPLANGTTHRNSVVDLQPVG